ncbi:MAG: bifunctional phosphoribosyl-AMP cyclohydrolase/phosphoribosyl-ATP diphosphatase HisIE [Coriobacteriales bacterium]|nr:bifunctional phosphoribosyl-AMP cyclohydrolase/phosphoribosyl-ATP diphosphatase HisIE [Coriobacteriales bacterium]
MSLEKIKFDENGLVPAIVQDATTNEVLMLAYMNAESLQKTLDTGYTWFWSRSRQELWNKGATSGNIQQVISINYDCDGDSLLIKVLQTGAACHTGEHSCFFNVLQQATQEISDDSIVDRLYKVIVDRKNNPQEGSYTNYLFDKGIDKILKKVGEENAEVIIAAKNNDKDEITYETCDLVYHVLVMLIDRDVTLDEIRHELNSRHIK